MSSSPDQPAASPSNRADARVSAAGAKPDAIKRTPKDREVRERIRARADEAVGRLDRSRPLDRFDLETLARSILEDLGQPEAFLGWTMVALGTAFWRDQVAATPVQRRLLLLPHCVRDLERCPARFDELGLLCQNCGACRLGEIRAHAEALGYTVLIAEGSPAVMRIILGGHADALVGVSCLDVLERSLEKILLAGVPCMAVPLWSNQCRDSRTDVDWVFEMIDTPYAPCSGRTHTYVHLLRCAKRMFEPEELEWLAPRRRGGATTGDAEDSPSEPGATDAVARTESVAYDFLLRGGKRARPFVTLAAYDAMTGGQATGAEGAERVAELPEAVKRVALAIEVFHKASLVHDDIEDDDAFRYGLPTVHRQHGAAMAINVGDYLIGLGYRLVADQRGRLPSDAVAEILGQLAEAHTRLSEGQGAELAWREAPDQPLAPIDALRIYALKTAPAFEAALLAGMRLAGPIQSYRQPIARYARHLGVAFQILNDLDDWRPSPSDRVARGTDVLGRRPTVLLALAKKVSGTFLENLSRDAEKVSGTFSENWPPSASAKGFRPENTFSDNTLSDVEAVEAFYRAAGVFDRAEELVAKHHRRARDIADQLDPPPLRHLLHYLADSILRR